MAAYTCRAAIAVMTGRLVGGHAVSGSQVAMSSDAIMAACGNRMATAEWTTEWRPGIQSGSSAGMPVLPARVAGAQCHPHWPTLLQASQHHRALLSRHGASQDTICAS